ncbi:MAG: metal-dependent transcriptional regulator [Dehalococcoidia bacterium]|nr:metal-dependent transcriptional regulator [Dehalococcoidia bacterium]
MPQQMTRVATDDALTTIYRMGHDEGEEVIAVRVAERLGVTNPTISSTLGRLVRDGLIVVGAGKRISLTPSGIARAEGMIRRHRLAECLLVNVLGLEWWRAYEEAHLLEHAISAVTEPLIQSFLGHPSHSPFGYPIPGNAPCEALPSETLTDVTAGTTVTVDRVFEESQDLLQFFQEAGIRAGVACAVVEHAPARGTVTVAVGGRDVVMGLQPASRIWITRAADR